MSTETVPPGQGPKTCSTRNDDNIPVPWFFCGIGVCLNILLFVSVNASQDILAGTSIPTTAVFVANVGPFFLTTLVAPYFIPKVPYVSRVVIAFVFAVAGICLTALARSVDWRLAGVCLISLGVGLADTSFLALTAFYDEIAVSGYAAGTGTGFVIAPFYYTGMTIWACVTPQTTILTVLVISPCSVVLYLVLAKISKRPGSSATARYNEVPYRVLHSTTDSDEDETPALSIHDKMAAICRVLPFMVILLVSVIAEFVTLQAVVTTLAFPQSPFSPRNHYLYYIFMFGIGQLFGRSYPIVASLIKPSTDLTTKHTWIFTAILIANLLFCIFASWYRFVTNVWIILALILEHGVIAGAMFVNTYSMAGTSEPDVRLREVARAFTTIGSGLGMLTSGIIGLWIEPILREHCQEALHYGDYCITRSVHGMHSNASCL